MSQSRIRQELGLRLKHIPTLEMIIREDALRSYGLKEETEGGRFCSLYPYLEPGSRIWLDISKDSEMNHIGKEIIEYRAEGNLIEKVKAGLGNEKRPVIMFYGIGYGENEAVFAKRLYEHFPDMDIVIIDASPTILKAGYNNIMEKVGKDKKDKVWGLEVPFEILWQLMPAIRYKYNGRVFVHCMFGNTIANPVDILLPKEYLNPLIMSANCLTRGIDETLATDDMFVASWHTLSREWISTSNRTGIANIIAGRYSTEQWKEFIISNLKGKYPSVKPSDVQIRPRTFMYQGDEELAIKIFCNISGNDVFCYNSGKHTKGYIRTVLKSVNQDSIDFCENESGSVTFSVSRPREYDMRAIYRACSWIASNMKNMKRKGGRIGQLDELYKLAHQGARRQVEGGAILPYGNFTVDDDSFKLSTELVFRTLAASLSFPARWMGGSQIYDCKLWPGYRDTVQGIMNSEKVNLMDRLIKYAVGKGPLSKPYLRKLESKFMM